MGNYVWMVWMDDYFGDHRFYGAYSTPQGAFDYAGRIMLEEHEQAKQIGLADKVTFKLVQNDTERFVVYYCEYFDEYIYVERVLLDDNR